MSLRVSILTREYPPSIYGGAGVHIEYLSKEVARLAEVEVRCYGDQKPGKGDIKTTGYESSAGYLKLNKGLQSVFKTIDRDLQIVGEGVDADIVHCHTWYTHMAGIWAKLNFGVPLVVTTHSLEPLRPWKREQLAGGYRVSSWAERTSFLDAAAVISVSQGMRADVLESYSDLDPDRVFVVKNGIDPDEFKPDQGTDVVDSLGVDRDRPLVVFVGRITRQKGLVHLVRAAQQLDPDTQLLLLAGAPDTPEIAAEFNDAFAELSKVRSGSVKWVQEMLPRASVRQVLTHATVFACPSVYEPLGIVNLEAMACETAVVASAVGGDVLLQRLCEDFPLAGDEHRRAAAVLLLADVGEVHPGLVQQPYRRLPDVVLDVLGYYQ